MELDLAEVYSFTVLVDHRHFGRAARQLHLSPSGLTKRIQRLERHLGVRLVERGPEGVVGVTTAGVRFADRARHLLVEARNTAIYAREATSTVVIGLPGALGPQSVAQWTGELSTRLRHLLSTRVHCIGVPFDDMATAVATGRVDILLSAVPSSEPAVVSTRLWPLVRVGVLARSHAVSGAPSIAVEDFAQLPMLRDAALPEKWMSLWWLGDVRPLAAARLVEIGARTHEDVLRRVGLGREVTVVQRMFMPRLPEGISYVDLVGAPPTWYYADYREHEPRGSIHQVVQALRVVSAPAPAQTPIRLQYGHKPASRPCPNDRMAESSLREPSEAGWETQNRRGGVDRHDAPPLLRHRPG